MSRPSLARIAPWSVLVAGLALGPRGEAGEPAGPALHDPGVVALAAGHSAFAVDLYGRIRGSGGNVVCSPYSVHSALAMARAGARGETAAQMDRVMRLPADADRAWKAVTRALVHAPLAVEHGPKGREQVPAYSLSVANSLFGQKGYPFVPAYRALLAEAYGAELTDVDFRQGPVVRKQINDWVLSKTRDRIKDLVPEGLPTPDTRLAIVNAIHFYGPWDEPFHEGATQRMPFRNERGEEVPVDMLRRTDHFRYLEDGDARVLAVPYRGGAAEMLLVLPKDPAGLAALEQGLTPERVRAWGANQAVRKAALGLPKFKFEAPIELTQALEAMGMTDAFDVQRADFRGMADVPGEPLFVGAVLHKAFIAVDEKGTEAAAATALMMRAGSAPRPEDPVPFLCDRPFLFLIRHRAAEMLLFMGRLAAPEPAR
jgi:serpin B